MLFLLLIYTRSYDTWGSFLCWPYTLQYGLDYSQEGDGMICSLSQTKGGIFPKVELPVGKGVEIDPSVDIRNLSKVSG